jgi:hypothetical protein
MARSMPMSPGRVAMSPPPVVDHDALTAHVFACVMRCQRSSPLLADAPRHTAAQHPHAHHGTAAAAAVATSVLLAAHQQREAITLRCFLLFVKAIGVAVPWEDVLRLTRRRIGGGGALTFDDFGAVTAALLREHHRIATLHEVAAPPQRTASHAYFPGGSADGSASSLAPDGDDVLMVVRLDHPGAASAIDAPLLHLARSAAPGGRLEAHMQVLVADAPQRCAASVEVLDALDAYAARLLRLYSAYRQLCSVMQRSQLRVDGSAGAVARRRLAPLLALLSHLRGYQDLETLYATDVAAALHRAGRFSVGGDAAGGASDANGGERPMPFREMCDAFVQLAAAMARRARREAFVNATGATWDAAGSEDAQHGDPTTAPSLRGALLGLLAECVGQGDDVDLGGRFDASVRDAAQRMLDEREAHRADAGRDALAHLLRVYLHYATLPGKNETARATAGDAALVSLTRRKFDRLLADAIGVLPPSVVDDATARIAATPAAVAQCALDLRFTSTVDRFARLRSPSAADARKALCELLFRVLPACTAPPRGADAEELLPFAWFLRTVEVVAAACHSYARGRGAPPPPEGVVLAFINARCGAATPDPERLHAVHACFAAHSTDIVDLALGRVNGGDGVHTHPLDDGVRNVFVGYAADRLGADTTVVFNARDNFAEVLKAAGLVPEFVSFVDVNRVVARVVGVQRHERRAGAAATRMVSPATGGHRGARAAAPAATMNFALSEFRAALGGVAHSLTRQRFDGDAARAAAFVLQKVAATDDALLRNRLKLRKGTR